jgi:hypothetical protein
MRILAALALVTAFAFTTQANAAVHHRHHHRHHVHHVHHVK